MAIVQISKIQQRSGNLVDLPQLDEAQFGFAADAKRLFIGKTTGDIENIEVLTSYSDISFSQINGSDGGNFNISNAQNGQILTYVSSTDTWENYTGNSSQLNGSKLQLGNVANIKIEGGAIGYVLETDGLGNLSWTPKGTLYTPIESLDPISFIGNVEISVINAGSFTIGVAYSINAIGTTTDWFAIGATSNVSGTTFIATGIGSGDGTADETELNISTINSGNIKLGIYIAGNSVLSGTYIAAFGTGNGSTGSYYLNKPQAANISTQNFNGPITMTVANTTPYVSGTSITISGVEGNANANVNGQVFYLTLAADYPTSGNVELYTDVSRTVAADGTNLEYDNPNNAIATSVIAGGGGGSATAGGANAQVQFNNTNLLDGDPGFTYNYITGLVSVTGNITTGNLNSAGTLTASRLISNVATGSGLAPLTVTSTIRVANLNVSYSNVSDFEVVTSQTTGTFYPVFVSSSSTGNYALGSNANISFNAATGNLNTILLNVTSNANIGNLGTSGLIVATGNITGGNLTTAGALSVTGNANVGNLGTGGLIVATGNITGGNIVTGGVVAATGNVSGGNLTTAGRLSVTGNANVGNIGAAAGIFSSTVAATGNVSGGNLTTSGALSVTGNANVGNIGAAAGVFTTVTGSLVTAAQPNVTSLGSLTGLTMAANADITLSGAGSNVQGANIVSASFLAGTLTTAAQPNITSIGTLTSLGVSGNITAANITANTGIFAGNGSGLTALNASNISSGTLAQARLANSSVTLGNTALTLGSTITSVTGLTSVTSTTFVGALTGAATSATTAGTVTTAAQPNITSVGTLTGLTLANASVISMGSNTNVGTFTGNFTLSAGSRLTATYADLAEYYEADQNYEPGTVLEFGGEKEVTIASDETRRVAGVVSTNPAYAMNAECPGHAVAIALQGRVPVKVRGTIRKGDMLVSGGNGYARPTHDPKMGTVIGKALENFEGTDGIIEIAVGRL